MIKKVPMNIHPLKLLFCIGKCILDDNIRRYLFRTITRDFVDEKSVCIIHIFRATTMFVCTDLGVLL